MLRVEIPALSSILPTFEHFQYECHDVLVLDLPILREVQLVLVWTVHTLFEYAGHAGSASLCSSSCSGHHA